MSITPPTVVFYLHHRRTGEVYKVTLPPHKIQLEEREYMAQVRVLRGFRVRAYLDDTFTVTRAYTLERGNPLTRHEIVTRAAYVAHQNERLRAALGFTDADLKANHKHRITPQQRRRVTQQLRRKLFMSVVVGTIVTAVFGVMFYFNARATPPLWEWVFDGALVTILAVSFTYLIRDVIQQIRAVSRGGVRLVSGRASPRCSGSETEVYSVTVNGVTFDDLNEDVYNAFVDGEGYDVYTPQDANVPLSAQMHAEEPDG